MLVCPACRQANPEGATVCEHCGSQLTASFALRGGRSAPPEIDIPARKQSPRWVPITVFSVIVVGALLAVGVELVEAGAAWARMLGFVALAFACVNIFGGFLVTQRMLGMYQKKKK